jgi:tryptophanyl-tRNA synthetase
MPKPVILTGLRTNAEYHLGNFLGALLPMVELQKAHLGEYQVNLFAPDLHSFTTEIEHGELFAQTMHNLKVFVAAGMPIDNPDFYMYRQSYIPAHSELTVILNNFAYFGELSRMTQFKDKSEGKDNISAGLFDYPVLMVSDILLYSAKYVPVGDDQRQHLELARDLGIRLNNKFGELFTVPEEWKKQLEFAQRLEGVRIRSLRNPSAKMSKSVDDPSGTIQLSDTPDEASKKIKTAETDSIGSINWDWENQAGITNLLQIYQLLSGKTQQEVKDEWTGNDRYGDLKNATAEVVASFLTDFQSRLANVNESVLHAKLESSEKAMNEVANATLTKVQKAVGLRG